MNMTEAWESFARSVGCQDSGAMRSAFFAGYIAGSAEQLQGAEETHRRLGAELKRLAQIELAMAQLGRNPGATQ